MLTLQIHSHALDRSTQIIFKARYIELAVRKSVLF
jgi:hypothetical protein